MSQDIKQQLRKKYLQILKNITPGQKKQWDEAIYQTFINSKYFANNQIFALYYSLPYEVNTTKIITALLNAQKKVVLPRMKDNNLEFFYINSLSDLIVDNQWKIYQPKIDSQIADLTKIDLIILPLVAYNSNYNRIGHGQGYYDRFLGNSDFSAVKLVLAYKVQKITEKLNFNDNWDISFDILITN
ncbi:MAG: 5-formyltetrahydrofolate cyclo-ligase [Spiroplasma sp.]|nr:5-formyltetrahydrofolate cyclo-ligase [Spiroplasma sp.]